MAEAALTHDRRMAVAWWFVLICVLVVRTATIVEFGMRHAGSDDVLFWNVANDFAHGIFREPYVYGQNYNPALESLLAVPLLWCHVPMHTAMPVSTSLLALLPFISFSLWHKRSKEWLPAMAFLAIPLLLPVQWDLITTMSRGFVTGIAALGALPWAFRIKSEMRKAAAIGFILGTALYLNPNAAIFGLPFSIWFLLGSQQRFRALLSMAAGSIAPLSAQFLSIQFYARQPWRIVHRIDDWRMEFHPIDLVPEGLQQLGDHFQWLMPVAWEHGAWALLLLAAMAATAAGQRQHKVAIAIAAVFPLILFSLSFAKTHDGFRNVLYPYDRMYLAIPLLSAWALSQLRWRMPATVAAGLVVVAAATSAYKATHVASIAAVAVQPEVGVPVASWPNAEFHAYADSVASVASRNHADLVIAMDGPDGMIHLALCYGGNIVSPNLPPTLYVGLDRRWWRRQEEKGAQHKAILFVGGDDALWNRLHDARPDFEALNIAGETFHLLHPAGLTTAQVMEMMGRKW
ncbi:MAG: hypothetical protein JST45_07855 [Bacteroidetes bacterium]|nr:hypothetical protein [Bacteroidota bacterium]